MGVIGKLVLVSTFFTQLLFAEGTPAAGVSALGREAVSYTHLTLPTIYSV